MRLLFLTPELPSPPSSGGTARMVGLLSNLARDHEIAVLAMVAPGVDVERGRAATGAYASEVVKVENPRLGFSPARKRARQLWSLGSRRSFECRTYHLKGYQRALDGLARSWRPDAIVVEYAQMGYVRFPDGVPVILDAPNVEHEIIARSAGIENSAGRLIYSRSNASKLRREERALARRVDAVTVTSERDRVAFRAFAPGVEPVVVPNGVDCQRFRPGDVIERKRSLLFYGALDYYPNADAILYFHREIWPSLRARYPNLELTIAGRLPPAAVRALAAEHGIEVTGLVDDIRPWIERAGIVIVPLRAGSGTRLKVLEALAMARPVVSTGVGVEGLDVEDGEHLLVADEPAAFARQVGRIIDDPDFGRQLGRTGRALVEARYAWRAIAHEFGTFIGEVVARRQEAR